jgi:hypothetical protein
LGGRNVLVVIDMILAVNPFTGVSKRSDKWEIAVINRTAAQYYEGRNN